MGDVATIPLFLGTDPPASTELAMSGRFHGLHGWFSCAAEFGLPNRRCVAIKPGGLSKPPTPGINFDCILFRRIVEYVTRAGALVMFKYYLSCPIIKNDSISIKYIHPKQVKSNSQL